jgi:REP element-mobilizing transposase RayT
LFRDFLLARAACQRFVQSSLLKDTQLLAWVLMPDHVHWLITLGNQSNLSQLITNLKSSSARAVNQCRQNGGAVWASAFYDHVLRNDEDIKTVARYIIANPLRAGLAEHMGDYSFWNCVWMPE